MATDYINILKVLLISSVEIFGCEPGDLLYMTMIKNIPPALKNLGWKITEIDNLINSMPDRS